MVGDGKAGREGTTYSLFTDFMACQGGLRVRLGIHPEHGRCASSNDLFSKQGDVMCGRNERSKNRDTLVGARDSLRPE